MRREGRFTVCSGRVEVFKREVRVCRICRHGVGGQRASADGKPDRCLRRQAVVQVPRLGEEAFKGFPIAEPGIGPGRLDAKLDG